MLHTVKMLDLAVVRSNFPAIAESDYIFGDNAGGSQCLSTVVARISDYLLHTNVQLGADYSVSVTSTNRVAQGAEAARELFNAASIDEIAYGASSTMLVENLARALEPTVQPGDEFIVTGEHEGDQLSQYLKKHRTYTSSRLSKCWPLEKVSCTQRADCEVLARSRTL